MVRLRLPYIAAMLALVAVLAACSQPNDAALTLQSAPAFIPKIWADGEVWGTKGNSTLPAPNDANAQSFDKLFKIVNSNNPAGQIPVAEAAPGNTLYNGGRWAAYTVEWTAAGFAAHGTVPVLTSYDDVMLHQSLGHLTVTPGNPDGSYPYFQCPLLPVK